jgi:DNA-binding response OmpR family regulator
MKRFKILIVEDDLNQLEAWSRLLALADYDVLSATSGQECLRLARMEQPDTLLLDVFLPDISGVELCRCIKADPELQRIFVIIVTGRSISPDDEAEGVEAGADGYLTKPVHLRTLLAYLQTVFRARQTETARELDALKQFPYSTSTLVSARSFGLLPLRESLPDLFTELTQHYGELLDLALEQRLYKVHHPLSETLRALGEQLVFLKAGPRDVVQIHHATLEIKAAQVTPSRAQGYLEEGRLLVLELMGYVASYYRNQALGLNGIRAADSQLSPNQLKREPGGDA